MRSSRCSGRERLQHTDDRRTEDRGRKAEAGGGGQTEYGDGERECGMMESLKCSVSGLVLKATWLEIQNSADLSYIQLVSVYFVKLLY